jgi:hypothetical protein
MKFRCGDISVIYWNEVAGRMTELFPSDDHARRDAEQAFFCLPSVWSAGSAASSLDVYWI